MSQTATHELTLQPPDAAGVARLGFATGSPTNAMNLPMLREMLDLCWSLGADDRIRVLLLHGIPGTFSGGADLARIAEMDRATWDTFIRLEFAVFEAIDTLPFVTVAALDGACLGNAAELALACDLRIATERTRFGFPETSIGFQGPAVRLTRYVGRGIATRLLFDGTVLEAEAAQELGLIDWVVPDAALPERMDTVAARYAALPPVAIRETKRNLAAAYALPNAAGEVRSSNVTAATEDAREGQAAFFARRAAVFHGR